MPTKNPGTKTVLDNDLRETKQTVEQIQKDCNALYSLSVATSASVGSSLQSVQDMASRLPAAVQADQGFSSFIDQPKLTLNDSVNIFYELARISADYTNDFDTHLATPVPASYFSL